MKLEDLKKKIKYKWKIQTVSKNKPKAQCVAYIDARDAMDLLDAVCGPENWRDEYSQVNGQVMCGVSIKINDEWVTKWDVGTSGDFEAEKSVVSDAFKRACVKWGVGRFLYDMAIEYVDTNEPKSGNNHPYPIYQHNKERIWDLTEYINSKQKHKEANAIR